MSTTSFAHSPVIEMYDPASIVFYKHMTYLCRERNCSNDPFPTHTRLPVTTDQLHMLSMPSTITYLLENSACSRLLSHYHSLCRTHKIAYSWPAMHDIVSDENLMLQYKDGDTRAFETLYARYRQPLFRYLQHQCSSAAIAEELFQDIWLNLIRTRERYQVSASFKTFIYHMAHNRLIDHYRKQKHGIPASYDEHEDILNQTNSANPVSAERQVQGEQQLARLHAAIAELPEAQREAFLLKENTGLSVEQIAEITGVNAETAKSRIRYALNKLRQSLGIEDHD